MDMLTRTNRGIGELAAMRGLMRSMFEGLPEFKNWNSLTANGKLEVDVNDRSVSVKLPCAGCKPGDFDIETSGGFLTVKVSRQGGSGEKKGGRYTCRERSWESFSESVKLPVEVKSEDGKASYKDGVLAIELPRAEAKKITSKTIAVK